MKSSAAVGLNSGYFRSTLRTQQPSRLSRFTRWPPMKPPPPHTSTAFSVDLLHPDQADALQDAGATRYLRPLGGGNRAKDTRIFDEERRVGCSLVYAVPVQCDKSSALA